MIIYSFCNVHSLTEFAQSIFWRWDTSPKNPYLPGLHMTLASSEWPQLWTPIPECEHEANDVSLPVQETSSSKILKVPWPNLALPGADSGEPYPSCRQTTCASVVLHPSSQTVPHSLLTYTSTRPSRAVLPPTRRTFQCPDGRYWKCNDQWICQWNVMCFSISEYW